ncbi:MAG: hypothetical protein FRX48_04881 [Lasallia pustulata]|uniref:Heterokaryon incompatibility domain-containing protein n=1 Tax=Lasallia pustulata TaxID=136370 RepID=A0A5M8PSM2_9LECA|nr:MAG: hypothetical protein FRX48_04881 [Lasallia pustulata]
MLSLSPGPDSFTSDRIEKVLRDDLFQRQPGGTPPVFLCDGWGFAQENGINRSYHGPARTARTEDFARELFAQVQDPQNHLHRLDAVFSRIIECNWRLKERVEGVVARVGFILTRLPERALGLLDFSVDIPQQYFLSDGSQRLSSDSPTPSWDSLQVAAFVSTNVIRVALAVVIPGIGMTSRSYAGFLDTTAELLDAASRLSEKAESGLDRHRWFIVRAFLWASWQRSQMLHFASVMRWYLHGGFNHESMDDLNLRGTFPSPRLSIQEMSRRCAGSKKAKFMCSWAFELLRTDAVSIGLDFRRFHERYSQLFGDRPARCILGSSEPCDGKLPEHCHRFKGMAIEDQSMHLPECPGNCPKLRWDEKSYRAVSGARAVCVADTDSRSDKLRYCLASKETLAVSHVWIHGQGGRPEDGMNRCLHLRYASIARSLGCDSYWMDTPCIPKDHKLRRESIARINDIFTQSKATVVCDADLMQIDVTNLTLQLRESILACVLVCDWSVRAWTFLEAIRGRHQIYLLCKNDQVVPFKETLKIVLQEGSIDLAILAIAIPHLLPTTKFSLELEWQIFPIRHGYLPIEAAGSLLSHRAASRPGDDIVIWSLLLREKIFYNAKDFWRGREGSFLYTGFLMSSVSRLKVRGLRWAPSSPITQLSSPDPVSGEAHHYRAFDGIFTSLGTITKKGFLADWLLCDIDGLRKPSLRSKKRPALSQYASSEEKAETNLYRIKAKYLRKHRWGALLQPVYCPASDAGGGPAPYRGDIRGTLLAVCASNDHGKSGWKWMGVYEWDISEPLPEFSRAKEILLV